MKRNKADSRNENRLFCLIIYKSQIRPATFF